MLPRPDAPARRLPYTTADMSERLAKRKAEQDAAAQAKANQAFRFGVTNPPAVKKDQPWYKDALGAVGGAIKSVYENIPMLNPVSTPINMGGDAGVSMGGQGTVKSLVTEPARLAVRRAVGDITAIPRVGEPSPSYTADQIREQGVARGVLGAAIDYSQFIPIVAKGAGFTGDAVNAYKLAMMERQANPFPALRGASNVIDVVPGSRLPSRIVEAPATPATRLAEAQTARKLTTAVDQPMTLSSKNITTIEKSESGGGQQKLVLTDSDGRRLATVTYDLRNDPMSAMPLRIEVDYLKSNFEGQGHGQELMQNLYDRYPNSFIDWGITINPTSTYMAEKFADRYYDRTAYEPDIDQGVVGTEGMYLGEPDVSEPAATPATRLGNAMAQMTLDARAAQGGVRDAGILRMPGSYPAGERYVFDYNQSDPGYVIDKQSTNAISRSYDKVGPDEKLIDTKGTETGVPGRSYTSNKMVALQSPQGNATLGYDIETRVINGTPQPRIVLQPISAAKGSIGQVKQLLDFLYGRYKNAVIDWGNISTELPNELFYEYNNRFPVRTVGESVGNPLENFNAPKTNINALLDTPQRGAIPYTELYDAIGVLDNNRIYPTSEFKQLIQKFGLQGREREVLDAFARREGIVEPSRLSSWQKFVNEMQRQIDMGDYFDENPLPTTAAELARLQREATRAEMGISIDDIEFPPQGSMTAKAKALEDMANAEIYATEIAVREGRVQPGWELKDKLKWSEFKKPYYEFIANARATQTAFDSYDHIHPEAWIEIGEAQRNSGFTYDQMPNEMRAIQKYFSNDYGRIQEYLSVKSYDPLLSNENFSYNTQQYALYQGREKVFGELDEIIDNIDRAFKVVPPVTRPFTTYRGVSISNAADPYVIAFYRNLKPGDLIYDPGYSSTSINKTLAEQWAGRPDDVVLIIQIPKGTSVVHPISSWTEGMGEFKYHDNAPKEKELLLGRNSTFRVIRNDGKFIEVELVPSNTSVTNVRTVDKETAKTMSFEDALAKVQDETVRQLITNPISTPFNPLVKGFNFDLPEGELFS